MAGQVAGEAVQVGAVQARRNVVLLDPPAAGGGVDGVPAVVGGWRVAGRVAGKLDVHEDDRVVHRGSLPGQVVDDMCGLCLAPRVGLTGGAVVVRVNARPCHEPVAPDPDAVAILKEVGAGVVAVGDRPDNLAAALLPRGPVPDHPYVAAIGAADRGLAVGGRPRRRDVAAVRPVPEAGRRVAGGQSPGRGPLAGCHGRRPLVGGGACRQRRPGERACAERDRQAGAARCQRERQPPDPKCPRHRRSHPFLGAPAGPSTGTPPGFAGRPCRDRPPLMLYDRSAASSVVPQCCAPCRGPAFSCPASQDAPRGQPLRGRGVGACRALHDLEGINARPVFRAAARQRARRTARCRRSGRRERCRADRGDAHPAQAAAAAGDGRRAGPAEPGGTARAARRRPGGCQPCGERADPAGPAGHRERHGVAPDHRGGTGVGPGRDVRRGAVAGIKRGTAGTGRGRAGRARPGRPHRTGRHLAIIELGGGFSMSDLDSYFSGLGVPVPSVTAVGVDGASNVPGQDPNGADGEVLLDIEVAGAVAPRAAQLVYFAPNTDQGFIDAVTTAAHATPTPTAISISWGQSEDAWTSQARSALDAAIADAAALGITVCVAAGDNGSSDGVSDGRPHADFPASSPHALACGGTSLRLTPAGAIASETVWNDGPGQGAGGGGVSDVFPLPAWQATAGVPAATGGRSGRGVPDVAGDADPETGYQVRVDGHPMVIGGTSAVAPLWAGLTCRLAQAAGTSFGMLQDRLYAGVEPDEAAPAFHDITSGSNGVYSALPGWDACTGLGSPDGTALLTRLKAAKATGQAAGEVPSQA